MGQQATRYVRTQHMLADYAHENNDFKIGRPVVFVFYAVTLKVSRLFFIQILFYTMVLPSPWPACARRLDGKLLPLLVDGGALLPCSLAALTC